MLRSVARSSDAEPLSLCQFCLGCIIATRGFNFREGQARQITEAFPWSEAPKYLIRDNDKAFGSAFKARIRAMGIRDRPTSFRAPWQNGCVERLIGSIRRECTDHLIVLYPRPIERFGHVVAHPILGGLHHRYARI